MGLKSIELQVAIPRSQDAGKMQEQLTRQGQQFQETLTQQQLKDEIVKRTKINRFDEVDQRKVDDKDKQNHDESEQQQSKKKKQKRKGKEKYSNHPYLGAHIDYTR